MLDSPFQVLLLCLFPPQYVLQFVYVANSLVRISLRSYSSQKYMQREEGWPFFLCPSLQVLEIEPRAHTC
jgi:hypothetical protein